MESREPESFHWRYIDFDDRNFQIRGRTFLFSAVFFCILLLITLLFLYSRCRYLRLRTTATSSPHVANPRPPQAQGGIDLSAIKSFSIVMQTSLATKTADESECCICLGVFQDGDEVKVLPNCRHCFHSDCVDKWLSSQASCPLCRSSLQDDSPV